jgi:hypothetical protein
MPPDSTARRLGRRLLELEGTASDEPEAIAQAAERAAGKLDRHLSRLVGVAGSQTLLKRALYLAGREHAVLAAVQPPLTANGGLNGLTAAIRAINPEHARTALAELFAQLIWLLVTFIGEDLTVRTLRQVWPEIELDRTNSAPEETDA